MEIIDSLERYKEYGEIRDDVRDLEPVVVGLVVDACATEQC